MGAGSATAKDPRWPGYDQATSGPTPPLQVITPGGAPPGRPANIRSVRLTACVAAGSATASADWLPDVMRNIVPAGNRVRATEPPWY
jgi:hypothetical protein